MSIYQNSTNKWEGVALLYCLEDWSYVSPRMVYRHQLEPLDGRILMTWRPNDSSESFRTFFIIHEGLKCDFMLGGKSTDEEFNRPSDDSKASQAGQSKQVFPNQTYSNRY